MKRLLKRILTAVTCITAMMGTASIYIFFKAFGREKIPASEGKQKKIPEASKKYQPAIKARKAWLMKQGCEDIYIKSYDNLRLYGRLLPPENVSPSERSRQPAKVVEPPESSAPPTGPSKKPTIILGIHGYRSDGVGDFAVLAPFYHKQGYYLCLPDDRAHGKSDGSYIGFGYHDRFDCLAWCKYLVRRFGENCSIYLHGISMGSATVLSCCDDTQLPLQVKGIIADCGYSSGWEQIGHVLGSSCHMPSFPMLYMYNSVCRIVGGYNLKDIRPIDSVTRSRVPVLFIHGDADNYVPTTMVYKLYNACKGKKELLVVHGAGHAMSYMTDSKSYEKSVSGFIAKTLAAPSSPAADSNSHA